MKLTLFFFLLSMTAVFADARAQRISLKVKQMPLEKVLVELSKQSAYTFVYADELIKSSKPVSLDLVDRTLEESLQQLLSPLALTYQIKGKSIAIKPLSPRRNVADPEAPMVQEPIRGRVTNDKGEPLNGASIYVLDTEGIRTAVQTKTDEEGYFELRQGQEGARLEVVYLGHTAQKVTARPDMGDIALKPFSAEVEEVVINTGYQRIEQKNNTGSYSLVGNEVLNINISSDILSRLEGNLSSLQFVQSTASKEDGGQPSLRVRGLATIEGNSSPLIVIDNFPFDGDINALNPNDIETVTVLKDASAAAIWGARAGNGVIVITTKTGKNIERLRINYRHSTSLTEKPDLHRNRNYLPSEQQIEFDLYSYEKGWHVVNDWTLLSPITELQIARDNNSISQAEFDSRLADFSRQDIRREALRHLYRNPIASQNHVDIQGGSEKNKYYFSAGRFADESVIKGNKSNKTTLRFNDEYKLSEWLQISSALSYITSRAKSNGLGISDILPDVQGFSSAFPYSYLSLVDDNGAPVSIPRKYRSLYIDGAQSNGLLDWNYYPVAERDLNENTVAENQITIDIGLTGKIGSKVTWLAKYFHMSEKTKSVALRYKDSYFVRDMVNRFTQPNGQRVIPNKAIIDGTDSEQKTNSGRFQLNFAENWEDFKISAMAGSEWRQSVYMSDPGYRMYDYDPEFMLGSMFYDYTKFHLVRPTGGSERIPMGVSRFSHLTDRFISYYFNATQSYKDRYHMSASARWDASNIFGVETNKKGVPLWSVGMGWNIDQESFFRFAWVNNLKLRTSFGRSGNVNNIESAYPTAFYTMDMLTNLPTATITSLGNPFLRWEQVTTYNIGIDFGLFGDRIKGSFDHYTKKGSDLIGPRLLAGSTGVYRDIISYNIMNRINYAEMTTKGMDLQLDALVIDAPIRWNSTLIVNRATNKINTFYAPENIPARNYLGVNRLPVSGKSMDAMYSLPWYGLSPGDGSPQVNVNGEMGEDYTGYLNQLTLEDLMLKGSGVPLWTGSIRNNIGWKRLNAGFMILWQGAYYFRRSSIGYNGLISASSGHIDFNDRWKTQGDEVKTQIPSIPQGINANRDFIYLQSEQLMTRGDHIRLQEVYLSFNLGTFKALNNISINFYARDLGVLWKENRYGIDPKYAYALYPPSATYSLGVNFNL